MKKYTDYQFAKIDYEQLDLSLNDMCHEKDVSIYGFGHFGKMLYDTVLWDSSYSISAFVDADDRKNGENYGGVPIISPSDWLNKYPSGQIIVTPHGKFDDIYKQLVEMGSDGSGIVALPFKLVNSRFLQADEHFNSISDDICFYKQKPPPSPPVTVFSLIYNTPPKLLRRAIESVLTQTYRDFIFLICDNGSTGETRDILTEYAQKDKRVKIVRYEKNYHPIINSSAFGLMLYENINIISTQYCCFIDSDDYYSVDFLDKTMLLIESNHADAVKVQTVQITEDSTKMLRAPMGFAKTIVADSHKAIAKVILNGFGYWALWGTLWNTSTLLCGLSGRKSVVKPGVFLVDFYYVLNALRNSNCIVMYNEVLHFQTIRKNSSSKKLLNAKGAYWAEKTSVIKDCLLIDIIKTANLNYLHRNGYFVSCCQEYLNFIKTLSNGDFGIASDFVDNTIIEYCHKIIEDSFKTI